MNCSGDALYGRTVPRYPSPTTQPQPQLLRRCAHGARVAGGIHGVIEAQAIGAGAAVVLIRGGSVSVFGPAAGAIRARAPIRVGVTRLVALAAIAVIIDLVQHHDHKDDDDDRHDELQDAGDEQHHARRREFARSLLDFLWGAAHENAGGDAGEQPANRPDYAGDAANEADQREDGTASQARFWLSGAHAIPKCACIGQLLVPKVCLFGREAHKTKQEMVKHLALFASLGRSGLSEHILRVVPR